MAAEQVRNLFGQDNNRAQPDKKDKLQQTKLREKEIKEAHKKEQQSAKARKSEEQREMAALYREERLTHPDSKRAARDARHAAKHEAKAADGAMCEHGVWKCRICFPHKTGK